MKKAYKFYVLLFTTLVLITPGTLQAQVDVNDSLALVALYNSTDGPNWDTKVNWLTTKPVDEWYGITVINNRVTSIRLGWNNLNGIIPLQLINLSKLQGLGLFGNRLNGTIPVGLVEFTELSNLNLSFNQLTGSIPSDLEHLGDNGNDAFIELNNNQLSDGIPPELGNIGNLRILNLSSNQLTGNIPSELGNCLSLELLFLDHNQLSGSIPRELSNCKNLNKVYLNNNHLTGIIPVEVGNTKKIHTLYLNNNQLSGNIPSELGNCLSLEFLFLDHNQLSGNIPSELGNCLSLQSLYLNNNQLTGKIPHEFGNYKALKHLYLDSNLFIGRIPNELGNLKNQLRILDLRNNKLTGTIPASLGNLINLRYLFLAYNKLSGKIPSSFKKLNKLQRLILNNNQLSDTIPKFLSDLHRMTKLNILNNNFNFDGLEYFVQSPIDVFKYHNQANIKIHQNQNTLSVYAGGTLVNNTYQWYKDGILISSINADSTFALTTNGNYSVRVINSIITDLILQSDTISATLFANFQQNNISSIELNNGYDFSVYPNPARTSINLIFNLAGKYTIAITNTYGKTFQVKTGFAEKGKNILRLDVSKYTAGIYFITLMDDKKQTRTLKLNKQ